MGSSAVCSAPACADVCVGYDLLPCCSLLPCPDASLPPAAAVSAAAHRDCANNTVVRLLTYLLFCCRQAAVGFMSFGKAGRLLAWPLRVAASMLQRPLNKVCMVLFCCLMQHSLKSDCAAGSWHCSTRVWGSPASARQQQPT